MVFNDKNEQEEMERQEVRTKAMEEAVMASRAKIFPRKFIAEQLVARGIFPSIDTIPADFWDEKNDPDNKNKIGQVGGTTVGEDVRRMDNGRQESNAGGRLRKAWKVLTDPDTDWNAEND